MSPRSLPYPVFDIDNHMYETTDALTKYLPKEHRGKVGYVEVNGRPKLVVKDHISHMIPTRRSSESPGRAARRTISWATIPKASTSANSSARQWMSSRRTSHPRRDWN
ncbi:amidohydrolase 2 domain protein [Mycobacterium intracellulare MIN_061107_1834]|nr:amidohydrolase 2 domain protein [Mycobacterium intracellulare MIN_061107_1834]